MSHYVLLGELFVAAAAPTICLGARVLDFRRDFLFLGIYLQSLLYLHVGPLLYARTHPDLTASYGSLAGVSMVLFEALFLLTYALVVRGGGSGRLLRGPVIEVSPRRFKLLISSLVAFSLTFWAIAWAHGLMYRRIGIALAGEQLKLSFIEFVLYRLYIDSLRYLVAVVVLGLVIGGWKLSWPWRVGIVLTLLSSYLYLVINSRVDLALDLLIVLGAWALFWPGQRGFWPRFAVGSALAAVLLLYSTSTTERIRVAFGQTWSISWRAFVPGVPIEGKASAQATALQKEAGIASTVSQIVSQTLFFRAPVEMPVEMRFNGLDFMARMQPLLQLRGYAWGRAWETPAALVFMPILKPEAARRHKLSLRRTAAKGYLMEEYTDIRDVDYVSCILTDAYGNFGYLGMAMVGIFLGVGCGLAVQVVSRAPSGIVLLVAVFAVCHLFQFEQEFISALLFWVKKLPFLLLILLLNPFRVIRGAPRAP